MNISMSPPGFNFADGDVWYAIVFKVSTLYFFGPKTGDQNCLFRNLKFNRNNLYS